MDLLKKVVTTLNETKLENLKIYETKNITPFFDYAVIVTANSSRQVVATVDRLRKAAEEANLTIRGIEGLEGGLWVLVDYNQIIVNIFIEEERSRYDLDKLWRTLPQVDPNSL
ncbi:MAG TPA: ribosome silencing factor [Acholeplasmataceae bacterium]|nr:ribosome silencing factor [Acholeplasmataceae bacterium]